MVNRQSRDPGELRQFDVTARVSSDVPNAVVEGGGQVFSALQSVAGQMANRLSDMADKAAARESETDGRGVGVASGASYLAQREAERRASSGQGTGTAGRAQVNAPGAIRKLISDAAVRHGVDPAALLKVAELESSFNSKAKNPKSSAGGLFQQIDANARQYGVTNRFDPEQSADGGARFMADNTRYLRAKLGRDPTAGELYLAHQQGGKGAADLLTNPNASAASVVGSDAVRLNGGTAGMTAQEFANLWINKAGGAVTIKGAPSYAIAQVNNQPLALRRDGTIAGEAFDRAAMAAYGWRVEQGLSTDLANAHAEFGDDPQAFAARVGEIRETYLADGSFNDPQLREAFDRQFAARSETYFRDVASKQESRLAAEESSASNDAIDARRDDIQRQAVLLGANPDGDAILADQIARGQRQIDAAVSSGVMTPAQASNAREKLETGASRARIQGVYEALATPEEKEAFATGLLDDWKTGEGPIAALSFDQVKALSATLYSDARSLASKGNTQSRILQQQIKRQVKDDIASMEATGQGSENLAPEDVAAALGPEDFEQWTVDRDVARRAWQASSGMEVQSAEDILTRLEDLTPEAGADGFAEDIQIFEAAQKRAAKILKDRTKDPLGFARENGIAEIKSIDVSSPETINASLEERLAQSEQISGLFDTPVPLFMPAEVKALKGQIGSNDPQMFDTAVRQIHFMSGQTSLQNIEETFGKDVVERLQDWQARTQYMTEGEAAAWMKERANPDWNKRVQPLIREGEKKAREIGAADIVDALDSNVFWDTETPTDANTLSSLRSDFERLVGERYAVTRNIDTAKEQAAERMKRVWGVTSAFGSERRGRLMPYPPEAYYPMIANSHDWIRDEADQVAKSLGAAQENLIFVSDMKTKQAADRGEPTGYLVSVRDPQTGLEELVVDEGGKPKRYFFDAETARKREEAKARDARETRNTPWGVFGPGGTSVGPLYAPWRPATKSDLTERERMIEKMLNERLAQQRGGGGGF